MEKKAILTDHAPRPIGPYSQAIQAGPWIFCSGQIALDPKTGAIEATEVGPQAVQVLENLKAVLTAANCSMENVVKTTIFLKSMSDFPQVNEIYGKYFTGVTPARSTIEVARLPRDVLVEIEAVAFRG